MYNKQAFESGNRGNCGSWGRGKFGGPWAGRGRFGGFWAGQKFGRHMGGFHQVPVNIEETDTEYTISLYAAGLVKENVKLTVKDDLLTVSYRGENETDGAENTTGQYTYQEYTHHSFERSFQLNNKVVVEAISATYTDGILKVILPKNPETNKPAQTITVA